MGGHENNYGNSCEKHNDEGLHHIRNHVDSVYIWLWESSDKHNILEKFSWPWYGFEAKSKEIQLWFPEIGIWISMIKINRKEHV